jgi:hypothetical protein
MKTVIWRLNFVSGDISFTCPGRYMATNPNAQDTNSQVINNLNDMIRPIDGS